MVGLIVLAALVRGLVWAAALPAWQGPDEPAHFSYIQRIAN
ncbi:MAG: putative rane protein, partial [Gaiellales bacterium]|nr:putative rane protein [Gaiellales bacterium]